MPFPVLLWRLLTLQSKAHDMPYSVVLLVVTLITNMCVTALGMFSPEISQDLAFKAALISIMASGASLYGMLRSKKLQTRFVQVWSAILVVDTICAALAVAVSQALGASGLSFLLSVLLSGWAWWVSVQFFMQAFEIKFWGAMFVSLVMQFAAVMALFLFLPELSDILNQANS